MNSQTRNFNDIKNDKFDEEGVSTLTSQEQVNSLRFYQIISEFYFYFGF